jgi:integrase
MAILFRRSNGVYYHVTSLKGKRIWRSTGKRSRLDAEKYLRNIALEGQNKAEKESRGITFTEFVARWRTYAETSFASSTIRLYNESIRNLLRIVGDRDLRAYTALDIEKFKAQRLAEVSPAKTNIDFTDIKALFNVATKWDLLEKSACAGVKRVKIPPQRPAYLSKQEFSMLIQSIKTAWLQNIVSFAVATMMRLGEIANLTWDSVDLDNRLILVENKDGFRLKTTQPRTIPMNDWVFSFLSGHINRSGYVFTFPDGHRLTVEGVSKKFKKACRTAGITEKIHFHSLRHTGASWLAQDGVSIFVVQKILGHSNIEVTMRYSHLIPSELHGAINKIRISAPSNCT